MTAGLTRTAIALRILCAAALLCLGFAHKPVFAHPADDPASSYYLLPDGTFADLCIDNIVHGKPQKSWLGAGCESCRLSASVLLPTPPATHVWVGDGFVAVDFTSHFSGIDRAIPRPGSPVRGPPSFVA